MTTNVPARHRQRVDRDPDRVPGAPPGYLRHGSGAQVGTCDRCGADVEVTNPTAKELHEKFHQSLRVMWATAQKGAERDDLPD